MTHICIQEQWFNGAQIAQMALGACCLPQILRETVAMRIVQNYSVDAEAVEAKCNALIGQLSPENQISWMKHQGFLSTEHFESWLSVQVRLDQFKRDRFSSRIKSEFLARKAEFDRVWYSVLRLPQDEEYLALELFMSLQEGEDFGYLAEQFSQGREKQSGGRVGAIPLAQLPLEVQQMFCSAKPMQPIAPMQITDRHNNEWWAIFRLDHFLPASFDAVEDVLLDRLYQEWLKEQVKTSFSTLKLSNSSNLET